MDPWRALKVTSHVLSSMMLEHPELEAYEPIRQVVVEAKNAAKRHKQVAIDNTTPIKSLRRSSQALLGVMLEDPEKMARYAPLLQRIITAKHQGKGR